MIHRQISATAGSEVAHLLRTTLQSYPPRISRSRPATGRAHPLGRYLCSFGYITPTHLSMALVEQRRYAAQGMPQFLGDILVQQGVLELPVVTTMLLLQLLDRLLDPDYVAPWLLGEYLVLTNQVTPARLAPALQVQTWLRHWGVHMYLGDILI